MRARILFSHVTGQEKQTDYLSTLDAIREGDEIESIFLSHYPNFSDLYFWTKTKRFLSKEGAIPSKGQSVAIPFWVEAAYCKNWDALHQLLVHDPSIVQQAYQSTSFCDIVFKNGPPHTIIEKIIQLAADLPPGRNPFLGIEEKYLPLASLNHTSNGPTVLCLNASWAAAKNASSPERFYASTTLFCARQIVAGKTAFVSTMPIFKEMKYVKAVLFDLIDEEKFHCFDNYFIPLKENGFSFEQYAYLTASGLFHLAETLGDHLHNEPELLLCAALRKCPNQDEESLLAFIDLIKQLFEQQNIKNYPTKMIVSAVEKQRLKIKTFTQKIV